MPTVNAAIATATTTITRHLATALEAAEASPVHGIQARAITATGGGATTKAKANMQVNGITPGTEATITAIAAAMSMPIHNALALL